MATIPVPAADMGFPGFVQFDIPGTGRIFGTSRKRAQIRALTCNLQLKQPIESPRQGKSPAFPFSSPYFDKMVHIVKPEIIEGTIEYPVVMVDGVDLFDFDPTIDLWNLAVERNFQERLRNFNTFVKYSAPESAFKYERCSVNSFSISCQQQDILRVGVEIWAMNRSRGDFAERKFPKNSRVVAWQDVFCNLRGQFGEVTGRWLRSFRASVSNDLERFYTAGSNLLKAQDIAPKLRDIKGDVTILGRQPWLAEHTRNNSDHCTSDSVVEIGYVSPCRVCGTSYDPINGNLTNPGEGKICPTHQGGWTLTMPNVIFLVEEIQLSNDVFETKVNWQSFPADKSMSVTLPLGIFS